MLENSLVPAIIIVAVFVLIMIAHIKKVRKAQYDERQLLARNAAFRYSFFFLLFYCFICAVLQLWKVIWAELAIQMFLGIILSLSLFVALCIIKDAYFSTSKKYNTNAVIYFFSYGVVNAVYLVYRLSKGKNFWENGQFSELILFAVAAVCLFALGIFSAIKNTLENRGDEK